ncbi:MAG: PD-(D/E)XK nuclease family protein [Treponemataceae bacterium]
MNKEFEDLLSTTKIIIDENDKKKRDKKKQGKLFNIFEILNVETNEVRLHSAFIAELLNPRGSHGLQDKFLIKFLEQIDFLEFPKENAKITKEKYIGPKNDLCTEGGTIDILIQSADEKYAVVIENKIYAKDQYKQLYRYKKHLENDLNLKSSQYRILYLTLCGDEPSEDSTGIIKSQAPFWENISYAKSIKEWIEVCICISDNYPLIRETLNQYLKLIKQLTNQTLEVEMEEQVIELLIQGENIRYVQELANMIEKAKQRIMEQKIIPELRKINIAELEFKMNDKIDDNLSKKNAEFWVTKKNWEDKNLRISFLFEVKEYKYFSYGIYRLDNQKEWDKQLFDKFTKLENNWWNKECDNCPYWNNIEGIEYGPQIPIECFSKPDDFVEKIKAALSDLAPKIDKIIGETK